MADGVADLAQLAESVIELFFSAERVREPFPQCTRTDRGLKFSEVCVLEHSCERFVVLLVHGGVSSRGCGDPFADLYADMLWEQLAVSP